MRKKPVVIGALMVLPTLCWVCMVVSGLVVLENELEIFPMEAGPGLGGLCHVDQVEIGDLRIISPPCCYTSPHYEGRKLGRTIWREKRIVLGMANFADTAIVLDFEQGLFWVGNPQDRQG